MDDGLPRLHTTKRQIERTLTWHCPCNTAHAADVPIEKTGPTCGVKEARLRVLSARSGHSVDVLRRMPEDTLRRLWESRNDVISHTEPDRAESRDRGAGREPATTREAQPRPQQQEIRLNSHGRRRKLAAIRGHFAGGKESTGR
jgi:hypothetical protein